MIMYIQMLETPEEQTKFEQLYLKYRSLMYHVAYKILHHQQDAEDAVHQAFLKIAEHMDKVEDPLSPKAQGYVVTIVENKAIDQYRKRQKQLCSPLVDEIHGIAISYEGNDTLTACILKLPARYREIILLRYHYGYSVREIAHMMSLSVSAASKLDQRAKNKLKALCQKEEIL